MSPPRRRVPACPLYGRMSVTQPAMTRYTAPVSLGYSISQRQAHALLLQRTGYQPRWAVLARRLGLSAWYDGRLAARLSSRKRERYSELYRRECRAEAASLVSCFPHEVREIVDIGCGLAGPDIELARLLPKANFTLVDQDEFDTRPHYGYEEVASSYNSLQETKKFLGQNGVADGRLRTVNVLAEDFPDDREVDVVISLISWGFHYPVETYARLVFNILRPGGAAIIDVRAGTQGVERLREVFGVANVDEVASPHDGIPRMRAVKPLR